MKNFTSNEENKHIALLIYKRIIGTITEEEIQELENWRKVNPRNEETYRHMLDMRFLEREYRRNQFVNSQRPLQDMKARIQRDKNLRRKPWRRAATMAIAASVAAIICISYFWNRPLSEMFNASLSAESLNISEITAGKTQATLTLNDGSEIILNADTTKTKQILAQAQKQRSTSNEATQINKLTTPRGGEFKIMLEDSTIVWLNAESQLIYPENFSKNERRVTVKGEAYFKVAKDSLRPFYVESAGMVVRVYGTEFNIHAYNEDSEIYTTLVSGSIALRPLKSTRSELILTPGHQAIFHKDDQSTHVRSVNTKIVTSWHEGRFSFEEQTLEQIMQTLSRWYNFKYEFKDKHLSNTIFKGSAPRYADLSEVLSILEKSGGISFKAQGEKIIISINK